MTKAKTTTDARVLVGIDISKNRHEVLIAVPAKTRRRRMTVLNTADDYQRLIEILRSFGLPVTIGFEATGNYHRALMFALGAAGFELKLVSSVALARTREALHNSWDKNDPKDAQVILHMLQIGAVQIFHDPLVAGTSDIQELSKTYEMVARAKTELWHRILTHYLRLYFPEADRFHRSSRGDWFLAFLEAFPSPHIITAMEKDAFIAAAWPVIGRRVSKSALLADIYETSKTSVGLPVAPNSDAIRMFRLVLAQGRSLIHQRNAIEARAVAKMRRPRKSIPSCSRCMRPKTRSPTGAVGMRRAKFMRRLAAICSGPSRKSSSPICCTKEAYRSGTSSHSSRGMGRSGFQISLSHGAEGLIIGSIWGVWILRTMLKTGSKSAGGTSVGSLGSSLRRKRGQSSAVPPLR